MLLIIQRGKEPCLQSLAFSLIQPALSNHISVWSGATKSAKTPFLQLRPMSLNAFCCPETNCKTLEQLCQPDPWAYISAKCVSRWLIRYSVNFCPLCPCLVCLDLLTIISCTGLATCPSIPTLWQPSALARYLHSLPVCTLYLRMCVCAYVCVRVYVCACVCASVGASVCVCECGCGCECVGVAHKGSNVVF